MICASITLLLFAAVLLLVDHRNRYSLFFAMITIGCGIAFFALLLNVSTFNNYYFTSIQNPFRALDNLVYIALMRNFHLPFGTIVRLMNLGQLLFTTSHIMIAIEILICMKKPERLTGWQKMLWIVMIIATLAGLVMMDPVVSTRLYIAAHKLPYMYTVLKVFSAAYKLMTGIIVITPFILLIIYANNIRIRWFTRRILALSAAMFLVEVGYSSVFLVGNFSASADKVYRTGFWYFELSQPNILQVSLISIVTMIMMVICLIVLLTFRMDGSAVVGMQRKITQNVITLNETIGDVLHSYKNTLFAIQLQLNKAAKQLPEDRCGELQRTGVLVSSALDDTARMLDNLSAQRYHFRKKALSPIVRSAISEASVPEHISLQIQPGVYNEHIIGYYDEYHIKKALINVLNNSAEAIVRAGKQDGRISVNIMYFFRWITIVIEDNGVGISRQRRKRIFLPHYSTKNGKLNWGLGMTQVYRVVTAHLGQIKISSRSGVYTTVMIMLPADYKRM